MKSSGNARSIISDQPIVRMSNTYLQPGDSSFEELFEDVDDGIYLKGSRGGQVDTGKGIFQFNAAEGYSYSIDNVLNDENMKDKFTEDEKTKVTEAKMLLMLAINTVASILEVSVALPLSLQRRISRALSVLSILSLAWRQSGKLRLRISLRSSL